MRGQAALEYGMILAIVLAALIPIVYLAYTEFSSRSGVALANLAADRLAQAVALVAAQGPGARVQVNAYWPAGVSEARVAGREVVLRVAGPGGRPADVYRVTDVNLTAAAFPTTEGRYVFDVEYRTDGNVTVSLA